VQAEACARLRSDSSRHPIIFMSGQAQHLAPGGASQSIYGSIVKRLYMDYFRLFSIISIKSFNIIMLVIFINRSVIEHKCMVVK
jgi:hypothetical protein